MGAAHERLGLALRVAHLLGDYTCRTEHATFMNEVNEAIDTVRSEHPEAFDGETVKTSGSTSSR